MKLPVTRNKSGKYQFVHSKRKSPATEWEALHRQISLLPILRLGLHPRKLPRLASIIRLLPSKSWKHHTYCGTIFYLEQRETEYTHRFAKIYDINDVHFADICL